MRCEGLHGGMCPIQQVQLDPSSPTSITQPPTPSLPPPHSTLPLPLPPSLPTPPFPSFSLPLPPPASWPPSRSELRVVAGFCVSIGRCLELGGAIWDQMGAGPCGSRWGRGHVGPDRGGAMSAADPSRLSSTSTTTTTVGRFQVSSTLVQPPAASSKVGRFSVTGGWV